MGFSIDLSERSVSGTERWISKIDQAGNIAATGSGAQLKAILAEFATRVSQEQLGAAIAALMQRRQRPSSPAGTWEDETPALLDEERGRRATVPTAPPRTNRSFPPPKPPKR